MAPLHVEGICGKEVKSEYLVEAAAPPVVHCSGTKVKSVEYQEKGKAEAELVIRSGDDGAPVQSGLE